MNAVPGDVGVSRVAVVDAQRVARLHLVAHVAHVRVVLEHVAVVVVRVAVVTVVVAAVHDGVALAGVHARLVLHLVVVGRRRRVLVVVGHRGGHVVDVVLQGRPAHVVVDVRGEARARLGRRRRVEVHLRLRRGALVRDGKQRVDWVVV